MPANRMPLPRAAQNEQLSTDEQEVWYLDEWECRPGDRFCLTFESVNDAIRHGVFVGVEGTLEINAYQDSQLALFHDTAPTVVMIDVVDTADGSLRVHNIWEDDGADRHSSMGETSGMVCEPLRRGARYRCCAVAGDEPDFGQLVFTIERL